MDKSFSVPAALTGKSTPQLGFMAHSVVVDNPTSAWVFLPEAQQYVPPFTMGQIIAYRSAAQTPTVAFQTPPGIIAVIPSGIVVFNFTDMDYSPGSGTTIAAPVLVTSPYLVRADIGIGLATSPQTFSLPLIPPFPAALEGDGLIIIVTQFDSVVAIPTLVNPAGWLAVAGPTSIASGAVAIRATAFARTYHPGVTPTSVTLVMTNTTNVIISMFIIRNVKDAFSGMVQAAGAFASNTIAAAVTVPGSTITSGLPGLELYAVSVNPLVRFTSYQLSGGIPSPAQAVTPWLQDFNDSAVLTHAVFATPATVIGTQPTLLVNQSASSAVSMGMSLTIPNTVI